MKSEHEHSILPINPRYDVPAISWSDVTTIESDVSLWYKRVMGLVPMRQSASMHYGTFVHNQIQRRKIKGIPHGNDPERTLTAMIRYKRGSAKVPHKFMIVGTVDDADMTTIYEYKTGLKLWTQKKASDHGQIPTYALLRREYTGIQPTKAKLVALETFNDEDAGICLTGKTRVLDVEITRLDVLKIQARFIAAYEKAIDYISTLELDSI